MKTKHEAEPFHGWAARGDEYAHQRGGVEFEPTDSGSQRLLYVLRLLVDNKMIHPLATIRSVWS